MELIFLNSELLNGVEFNVYDIIVMYYLSKDIVVLVDVIFFVSVMIFGEGLVNLIFLGKFEGKDVVYVFVEILKFGVEMLLNIVLSLFFYNFDLLDFDKFLDMIYLYVKNVIKESNIKI